MSQSGGSKGRRGPASFRGRGGYGVPAHLRWLQGRSDLDEERFHDSLLFQIYIFEEPNFEGDFIEYTGPTIMPDPKYQFGVSHQSLVWLEKHQANKKNDDRKKDNKCSSGLADRTTIRCSVLGPTSGPASRFFLK